MTKPYRIGRWRFDPDAAVLLGPNEEHRLEDRAARTLELLCRRRGDVVSKQELIQAVWQGRSVSSNSVAVVIGNLRRALDDDSSAQSHIATVTKRGYRLLGEAAPPRLIERAVARTRWRRIWVAVIAVTIAALVVGAVSSLRSPPKVDLIVEPVVNATGRADLAATARSLNSVLLDAALRAGGDQVSAGSPKARMAGRLQVAIQSRLILWNGAPELAMTATKLDTGDVIWSAFAAGPPAALARNTAARIVTLKPVLRKRLTAGKYL